MFRLANLNQDNHDEGSLYRYLSSAISATIIDCLNEYLDDKEKYSIFYDMFYANDFFSGISRYIKPRTSLNNLYSPDDKVGSEFTLLKMKRMKEKMQDQTDFYTFDVFEERILFNMCKVMSMKARTAKGKAFQAQLKDKVETAKNELREKYGLRVKDANDYSKKMYYASAMLLKDSEEDNLIFWDDDYAFFWRDGFVKGTDYLKGLGGQNAGYGYQYVGEIFSDVGLKPPLMLLGTEEANKIATEVQREQFIKGMNEVFGNATGNKSIDD